MKTRFRTPEELLLDPELLGTRKIDLLRNWEFDERQLAVAVDEGMPGPGPLLLRRILEALSVLEESQALPTSTAQGSGSSEASPSR